MLGLLRSRVVLSLASPTTASALRPVVVAPRRLMSSEAGDTEAAGQMDEASASSPPAGRSFVGVNRVTLAGYVQDAPAYIDTKNGGKMLSFSLATYAERPSRAGGMYAHRELHRVMSYTGGEGDVLPHLGIGDLVFVDGSLTYSSYTDKNEVKRRTARISVSPRSIAVMQRGDGGSSSEASEQ